MKKTHKKVFGFLGLLSVAAVTAVAAFLPTPSTQATTTTVTDTISVKVVGTTPSVDIEGIDNGEIITAPTQTFTIYYENVDKVTVDLQHTDLGGATTYYTLDTIDASYDAGARDYVVYFNEQDPAGCIFDESGTRICNVGMTDPAYGSFVLKAVGEGVDGVTDSDAVTFYYYPAYAELVKVDGKYYLDVYYSWDDGSGTPAGDVGSIAIKIYYPNSGREVPFSPINVGLNASGVSRVELPFEDYWLEEGDYKIGVYAYDRDNQLLSSPYTLIAEYRISDVVPVPDTGGLFQNTNISQTDYLVTGLIVFGIIAVAGTIYIVRSSKRK